MGGARTKTWFMSSNLLPVHRERKSRHPWSPTALCGGDYELLFAHFFSRVDIRRNRNPSSCTLEDCAIRGEYVSICPTQKQQPRVYGVM